MKKEDFKFKPDLLPVFLRTCKAFEKSKGSCARKLCDDCPFSCEYNAAELSCVESGATQKKSVLEENPKLVESARKFIKLFGETKGN